MKKGVNYLESSFHGGFVETREGSSCVCCFKLSGGEVGFLSGARFRVRAPVEARKLIIQVAGEEDVEDEKGAGAGDGEDVPLPLSDTQEHHLPLHSP